MTREQALDKARAVLLVHRHCLCAQCENRIATALLEAFADGLEWTHCRSQSVIAGLRMSNQPTGPAEVIRNHVAHEMTKLRAEVAALRAHEAQPKEPR